MAWFNGLSPCQERNDQEGPTSGDLLARRQTRIPVKTEPLFEILKVLKTKWSKQVGFFSEIGYGCGFLGLCLLLRSDLEQQAGRLCCF